MSTESELNLTKIRESSSERILSLFDKVSSEEKEEIIYLFIVDYYEKKNKNLRNLINNVTYSDLIKIENNCTCTRCIENKNRRKSSNTEESDKETDNDKEYRRVEESLFFKLCRQGSKKIINYLIEKDLIDYSKLDSDGNNCLHILAEYYHFDIILDILNLNLEIDLNQKNNDGNTPFTICCMHENSKDINDFLIKYVKKNWNVVNTTNNNKDSPIMFLIDCENWTLINYILKKDENNELNVDNINSLNYTFLMLLIIRRQEDIALKVIEKYGLKNKLDTINSEGETVFMMSMKLRLFKVTRELYNFGIENLNILAKSNSSNENALTMSIYSGLFFISNSIIDYTIEDIDIKTRNNISPLMLAIDNSQEELALKIIEKSGGNLDFNLVNKQGDSILILAAITDLEEVILKILSMNKGNPEFVTSNTKTTVLFYTIKKHLIKATMILFERTPFSVYEENEFIWRKLYDFVKTDSFYIENKRNGIDFVYRELEDIFSRLDEKKRIQMEIENKIAMENQKKILEEIEEEEKRKNELKKQKLEKERAKREAHRESQLKANQLKAEKEAELKAKKEAEKELMRQRQREAEVKRIEKERLKEEQLKAEREVKRLKKKEEKRANLSNLTNQSESLNLKEEEEKRKLKEIEKEIEELFNKKYEFEEWYLNLAPISSYYDFSSMN